jgi:alpha-tubulin suppressor-like RCC1 family protein
MPISATALALWRRCVSAVVVFALACFGLLALGTSPASAAATGPSAIVASTSAACALEGGAAYCWGDNNDGELGNDTTTNSSVPVAVDTSGVLAGTTLTQISAGVANTCALDSAGMAYCWGYNGDGELGNGTTTNSNVPVAVDMPAGVTFTQISTGYEDTCALDSTGTAYCWGYNLVGVLGDGPSGSSSVPVAVDMPASVTFTQISAGFYTVCALDSAGAAYCWGDNNKGQLGNGTGGGFSDVPMVVDMPAGVTFTQVSTGGDSVCAVDSTGAAYCWGWNNYGELGDPTAGGTSDVPVAVDTSGVLAGTDLTQISAGSEDTCAVDSTGAAYCWGWNYYGELGDGATTESGVPVAVDTSGVLAGTTLTQISVGGNLGGTTCARDTNSAAYCWGWNDDGELGDGTTTDSSVPVAVSVEWPPGAPDAPTAVNAVAGNGAATVSWSPAGDGGSPITSYTVTASDVTNPANGGQTVTGTASPLIVTGLTGGDVYTFAVTATNSVGTSAPSAPSDPVTIGQPPEITSPAGASTGMRSPFSFTVTTTGTPTAAISESGTLPAGVTFTDNGNGTATLAGTAAAGTAGSYPITITASNNMGSPASQLFTLTVTSAASAPVITSSPAITETFGVAFSFTVTTTGYPVPKLGRTGPLPSGVTFTNNGDGTATISGTPSKSAVGVYPVTLTAKSAAGATTQAFTLTITKAPVIKHIPTTTAHVGIALNLVITAKGYTTPALTESGTIPSGLNFTDSGNGTATITGRPAPSSGGSYQLAITATNQLGTTSQTFTLNVDEAPTITSSHTASGVVGSTFSFRVTAAGFPAPKITKTGMLPKGLTFHPGTAILSGTPKAGTSGTYSIVFTAANRTGVNSQNFTLIIAQ